MKIKFFYRKKKVKNIKQIFINFKYIFEPTNIQD